MKKYRNFIVSIVFATILGVSVYALTSCGSLSMGNPEPTPPGQALVLTETTNVVPEKLQTPEVIKVPASELGGEVGDIVRQLQEQRQSELVITTEENLANTPNALVIRLDENSTKDLLSPSTLQTIVGAVGGSLPGSWQPWLGVVAGLLGLFSTRFRTHTVNAVKRTVPGVQGPNNDGRMTTLDDLREALVDVTKAVTFAPTDSPEVVIKKEEKSNL